MPHELLSRAKWVAPSAPAAAPVTVRRFTLERVPARAALYVTGLGFFRAALNGRPLGEEYFEPPVSDYFRRPFTHTLYPCRDRFTHRAYYRTFDAAPYLREGENLLEIQCGGGFFVQTERIAEGEMTYSDRTQCLFALDAGDTLVLSDGSETWRDSPIRESSLFTGETVDARFTDTTEHPVELAPLADTVLTPEDGCPDRIIETRVPTLLGAVGGRRIYDAGENVSGFVRIRTHAPAGSRVTLRFAENLAPDGSLDFATTGAQHIGKSGKPQIMSDTFISAGQPASFAPSFVWHAFRYFDAEGDFDLAEVCVVHADTPVTATFTSDNEGMNFLYDAYLRTQLNNLHGSVPSDCPHRERLGYTGDGQVCAPAAMLLLDCQPLYRKWIRDILDCQDPDSGHVQHTAPFQGGGGGPGGWGAAVVTVPFAYYKQYGDAGILAAAYPAMQRWFRYMQSRSENGRVTREEDGGWCLGDWCFLPSGKLPEPFVNTALYARALGILARIARIVGDDASLPAYGAAGETALAAVREDYAPLREVGAAMILAAVLGIDSPARATAYYDALGHLDTGFLTTDLLFPLLWENGYADVACRLLSSEDAGSFLYMKRRGATTVWERWNGGSHDHPMFGACARTLLTGMLGIRQTDASAGWEEITLAPALPAAMQRASGSIVTPRGEIAVSLNRTDSGVRVLAWIPASVRAARADGTPLAPGKNEFFL